ncbi:N-acyl homoserine lactonase family protein [Tannockella kyphosi]|uniref:N-acyl homoserine lactonase family protein n=1 Tax=Tannockella kyphosi TaxID=2899121 RepID=UPI0020129A2C|nr:N-acyl homoserine lactonase family protein [Tannockella kyphosi]
MSSLEKGYVRLHNIYAGGLKLGAGKTPVAFYLIEHKDGKILFDTGMPPECMDNLTEYWGPTIASISEVDMTENELVVNALDNLGLKVEDIKYVIQSHLHLDHSGGIGFFPNATYIVQESEWQAAHDENYPYPINQLYIAKDFDKAVNWKFLKGIEDDCYDLFGDGSVVVWFTPGHTPGHQSLVLNTKKHGRIVLTADACNDFATLQGETKFSLCWNETAAMESLARLQKAQKDGYTMLFPHDVEKWKTFKKYYD